MEQTNCQQSILQHRKRAVRASDFPEILSWFKKRDQPEPPLWGFSDEGLIVPGVAAGFLYLTNSSMAFLDSYVTNPEAYKADRKKALIEITQSLIMRAKHEHEIKLIICTTKVESISALAREFKFEETGDHHGFAREL